MTSMDELDARVTALEHEVRVIRGDAAAARVLAGGADRDVAAMGATLRDHTAKLDGLIGTVDGLIATVDGLAATIDGHSATLDSHSAKLDMHKVLLESLRETQVHDGRRIDSMQEEMRRGFSMLAVGQAEILALLTRPDGEEPAG